MQQQVPSPILFVLLFAALLVAGCGEKSSSEGSEAASDKPTGESSADTAQATGDSLTIPLSDDDVERLLKETKVNYLSLQQRKGLSYQINKSKPYSGWTKVMWDSGQVSALVLFKDGKRDGPMTMWHENGQKSKEGTFKDGKWDGPFTTWYENGQKQYETTYKRDGLNGTTTAWHENGQKQYEGTYKDEALFFKTRRQESGKKRAPLNYARLVPLLPPHAPDSLNTPEGGNEAADKTAPTPPPTPEPSPELAVGDILSKAVHMSRVQKRRWSGPNRDGGMYHLPNTEVGYSGWIKATWPDGTVGNLFRVKDGKLDGPVTSWYANGQKEREAIWKDGKPDGLMSVWYNNGQKLSEVSYKDGSKQGSEVRWFENGQMEHKLNFKDGEKEGFNEWWYADGQKKFEVTYKNGTWHGIVRGWDANGNPVPPTQADDIRAGFKVPQGIEIPLNIRRQ